MYCSFLATKGKIRTSVLGHLWILLSFTSSSLRILNEFGSILCCYQHESALSLCKQSFQETPNPSIFPSVHSSPRALLTFTSDVFAKWLALNCPVEKVGCVFPSPPPLFTTKIVEQEEAHSVTEEITAKEESEYGKEGERGKRWLVHTPTNWAMGLCDSPFSFLCILCCLSMLLDVMLKELG